MNKKRVKTNDFWIYFWIIVYVVGFSIGKEIDAKIKIVGLTTVILGLLMTIGISYYLSSINGWKENGFNSLKGILSIKTLFCIPFLILSLNNIYRGIKLNYTIIPVILSVVTMIFVGFLEEVIFRGLLFRSLLKSGAKLAIIISSVTFGIGHIVNLLSGAELFPTLLQLIYAVAIGFMLSVFVYKTNNIIPCIIFHSIFNALSVFSNMTGINNTIRIISCVFITVISLGYACYLWYKGPTLKESDNI